ncbi:Spy/CpxP family protein refolding chaperone [Derxia gummosa]|uniref:Spy/CpxP family protein refolding chaperone n=1 Tax=Derxia gummosa DSM 723 TaxID=1121388 RepID=A0A8B6XBJ1_9BURK|nr:Spy/CpxP family protein refolding chaperone [Derxia gummosa]
MFKFTESKRVRRLAFAGAAALAVGVAALPLLADAAADKTRHGAPEACPMTDAGQGSMRGLGGPGMHGPDGQMGMPLPPPHLLKQAGASDDQIARIRAIVEAKRDESRADHEKLRANHDKLRELLTAPSIDRAAIDKLRAEQSAIVDAQSRRMTGALEDAAEVLTPEQRAKLATLVAEHREHGPRHRGADHDGARPGPDGRPPAPDQPPRT